MASYPPPIQFISPFNSIEYSPNSTALTYGKADARYLKLTGGTETGLVSFNSGLYSAGQITVSAADRAGTPWTAPKYSFNGATNAGFYLNSDDSTFRSIGLAITGSYILDVGQNLSTGGYYASCYNSDKSYMGGFSTSSNSGAGFLNVAGQQFCSTFRAYSGNTINKYPQTDNATGSMNMLISPSSAGWSTGGSAQLQLGDTNHTITATNSSGMTIADTNGIKVGSNGTVIKNIVYGTFTTGAPGANFQTFTVSHGLGSIPVYAIAIVNKNGFSTNDSFTCMVNSWSSTQIVFMITRTDVNSGWGNSYAVNWNAFN